MRKRIQQNIRMQVYDKYNGHCAYCGCELAYKDMQVDHIESVYVAEVEGKTVDDSIHNYMPSCRMCNYYKHTNTIEQFRSNITNLLMPNLRKQFDYRFAVKYGIVVENDKPIKFYFEKL